MDLFNKIFKKCIIMRFFVYLIVIQNNCSIKANKITIHHFMSE